jgi:hypothetical protein
MTYQDATYDTKIPSSCLGPLFHHIQLPLHRPQLGQYALQLVMFVFQSHALL